MHFMIVSDFDSIINIKIIDPDRTTILKSLEMNYSKWPVSVTLDLEQEQHGRVGIITSPKKAGDEHVITPTSPSQLGFTGVEDVITGLRLLQIAFPSELQELLEQIEAKVKPSLPSYPRPNAFSL